jgi:uncharacterized protein YjiS (DUF1127 family)
MFRADTTLAAGLHGPSALLAVREILRHWWTRHQQRRAQRATVMLLGSLDRYVLHDIGLDRSEIESIVYGSSPGERRVRYEPSRRATG